MAHSLNISEFRAKVAAGERPRSVVRVATSAEAEPKAGSRTISFTFSDSSVDRVGDTIDAQGWRLDEFRKNPVALFGHDSSSVENIIGKASNVHVEGTRLLGDIEFMAASVNPKADAVFKMIKGGFINAVSVGFMPIEWNPNKNGGISFTKQSLLEISVVPVGANPNALTQARAAGINVDRLFLNREARLREAREIVARARSLIALVGEDAGPLTREQRLAEARNFRRALIR
jgi:HK97 family phage prohead protease